MRSKLFFFILAMAFVSFAKDAPKTLPNFSLPDLQGKTVSSTAWKGKVVVLDFWATWCVACREAFPILNDLQQKYGDKLIVYGISSDKGSAEKVQKFISKQKILYPILLDSGDSMSAVFGYESVPSLYVFDAQGKLLTALTGLDEANQKKLETTVALALK